MASSKKPRHVELQARLETFLRQVVQPGQRVLLGLSGGLDSCVLLHLLAVLRDRCQFELSALHVNHGISTEAGDWQQFCAELCADWKIPFFAASVIVPRESGLGIEAAARNARYAVLLAQSADYVALAHHQDDQAETLLLQLLRGAGVKGLAAMPAVDRSRVSSAILRPLLEVPREVLECYAEAHGLRWVEDESNLDLAYDRNFLRHHVFPELEKRFPASRATLARSAAHLAEASALLDEVARDDAELWVRNDRLNVAGLSALTRPRATNLLRFWLANFVTQAPSTSRLQDICRQLTEARDTAMIDIPLTGGRVHRYRGEAWFERAVAAGPAASSSWRGESELQWPGGCLVFEVVQGKGVSLTRLAGEHLQIRLREGGERMRLHRNGPARSLKNLYQEASVPPWQRTSLPLIYWRDTLVAVPGIGVAAEWQAGPEEDGVAITWRLD